MRLITRRRHRRAIISFSHVPPNVSLTEKRPNNKASHRIRDVPETGGEEFYKRPHEGRKSTVTSRLNVQSSVILKSPLVAPCVQVPTRDRWRLVTSSNFAWITTGTTFPDASLVSV